MNTLKEQIKEKIEILPEPLLRQILDIIDSSLKKRKMAENDPILAVAGILSGSSISSSKEIDNELYGKAYNKK